MANPVQLKGRDEHKEAVKSRDPIEPKDSVESKSQDSEAEVMICPENGLSREDQARLESEIIFTLLPRNLLPSELRFLSLGESYTVWGTLRGRRRMRFWPYLMFVLVIMDNFR